MVAVQPNRDPVGPGTRALPRYRELTTIGEIARAGDGKSVISEGYTGYTWIMAQEE